MRVTSAVSCRSAPPVASCGTRKTTGRGRGGLRNRSLTGLEVAFNRRLYGQTWKATRRRRSKAALRDPRAGDPRLRPYTRVAVYSSDHSACTCAQTARTPARSVRSHSLFRAPCGTVQAGGLAPDCPQQLRTRLGTRAMPPPLTCARKLVPGRNAFMARILQWSGFHVEGGSRTSRSCGGLWTNKPGPYWLRSRRRW